MASSITYLVAGFFPQTFAVQLIWLSPAFTTIGGGGWVAGSVVLTIVADVVSESQR